MTPRAALLAALLGLSCSSAPLRGGHAEAESPHVASRTLRSFVPGRCEDAAHGELPSRVERVDLVETESGRLLILEHRQGHELLVGENHYDVGPEWVFDVLVAETWLRRFRIPRSPRPGTLELGRPRDEQRRGSGFKAELASVDFRCTLLLASPLSSEVPASAGG